MEWRDAIVGMLRPVISDLLGAAQSCMLGGRSCEFGEGRMKALRSGWTWHRHGCRTTGPFKMATDDGEQFEVTVSTIRPGSDLERIIEEHHAKLPPVNDDPYE